MRFQVLAISVGNLSLTDCDNIFPYYFLCLLSSTFKEEIASAWNESQMTLKHLKLINPFFIVMLETMLSI